MAHELSAIAELLKRADALNANLSSVRPLPKAALQKIEAALAIEYTYESNRIEGNTLTLQETDLVVNEGMTISGKTMREHLEAINHAQAISFIKDLAKSEEPIGERSIKDIHALILHGIDRENAGRYRQVPVRIVGSRHQPPSPFLLEEQMENFLLEFKERESRGEHPLLIAAFLHERLVGIHPFIDGNGRTSRLLMNLYLLQKGFVIVNLKGKDESRLAYYNALEEAHTNTHPEPFQCLVVEAEIESLENYISLFL